MRNIEKKLVMVFEIENSVHLIQLKMYFYDMDFQYNFLLLCLILSEMELT